MTKHYLVRNGMLIAFAALVLGFGFVVEAAAQNRPRRQTRPRPVPVRKPVVPRTPTSTIGSGIGGANGSGVGGATGNGMGTTGTSGLGQPSGIPIIRDDSNSTGNATGTGTGTNDASVTAPPAAIPTPRTYIKEINGRCYYVTNAGSKRYVARGNCSMYP